MLFPPVTAKYKGERVRIASILSSERNYVSISDAKGQTISGIHTRELSNTKIHDNIWEVPEFLTKAEQRLARPKCERCGKDFIPSVTNPSRKRFCSSKCAENARHARRRAKAGPKTIVCSMCGKTVEKKNGGQKYCPEPCAYKAYVAKEARRCERRRQRKLAAKQ